MSANIAMLKSQIKDARAWGRADVVDTRPWAVTLPDSCWALAKRGIATWRKASGPIVEVMLNDAQQAGAVADLAPVRHQLDAGCGFVVIDRLPMDELTADQAALAYWLIGQMIGQPLAQNVQGTLLYDVRDTGADYTKGARFSVTNAPSSYHTDGAFNPTIADYVGLLCVRTAKSGGENQMLSAYSLHNALAAQDERLLRALYEPLCFDRRGQFAEGESPVSEHPVFSWDGIELTMRYLNYYIHEGHRTAERPLSQDQLDALAAIEALLQDENQSVEFSLEPGQMLLANNHWTLHSRSGYEDYEDAQLRRHYVRLWLSRR